MMHENQLINNGRYKIVKTSTIFEFGQCYEAFDNESQKKVLVKEITETNQLLGSTIKNSSSIDEFAKTAEKLRKLKQKMLVDIKDYFTEDSKHYLVADNIEGTSIKVVIQNGKKPCPFNAFLSFADKLLDAVGFLHAQFPPIFHQDINPHNIFLTKGSSLKLSIINLIQNSKPDKFPLDQLSESKNLGYSPLEAIWQKLDMATQNIVLSNYDVNSQSILEKPVDSQSDIYSLGAAFYFLLTAKTPVDSKTRVINVLEGSDDPLIAPHIINSEVPPQFSDIIMKCMEIKREHRPISIPILRQIMKTVAKKLQEEEKKPKSVKNNEAIEKKQSAENTPNNKTDSIQNNPVPVTTASSHITQNTINELITSDSQKDIEENTQTVQSETSTTTVNQNETSRPTNKVDYNTGISDVRDENEPAIQTQNNADQQLELMKKKLQQAEEEKRAAELKVIEAERLLNLKNKNLSETNEAIQNIETNDSIEENILDPDFDIDTQQFDAEVSDKTAQDQNYSTNNQPLTESAPLPDLDIDSSTLPFDTENNAELDSSISDHTSDIDNDVSYEVPSEINSSISINNVSERMAEKISDIDASTLLFDSEISTESTSNINLPRRNQFSKETNLETTTETQISRKPISGIDSGILQFESEVTDDATKKINSKINNYVITEPETASESVKNDKTSLENYTLSDEKDVSEDTIPVKKDYLKDSLETESSGNKSLLKFATAALILLLLGGGATVFWSFYSNTTAQKAAVEEKTTQTDTAPPTNTFDTEKAETLVENNDTKDTEGAENLASVESNETVETEDAESNVIAKKPEPKIATKNDSKSKGKKARKSKQAVKQAKLKRHKKQSPKAKPKKPAKKAVTLDDLLQNS